MLIALLAGGHVLIEGVPGLGKTLLVRALAQALDCGYARVQFTPDLMPSDISGHAVYDPKTETLQHPPRPGVHQPAARRRDQSRAGEDPVGAARGDAGTAGHDRRPQLRAAAAVPDPGHAEPGRTGRHLSAAGSAARPLPAQDPDRLSAARRREAHGRGGQPGPHARPTSTCRRCSACVGPQEIVGDAAGHRAGDRRRRGDRLRGADRGRHARLGRASRSAPARAAAWRWCARRVRRRCCSGRDFVTPDDVREIAKPALRHRIALAPELQIEGQAPDDVLHALLAKVEAPRQ